MERKFTLSCCSTVDLPYSYMESRDIPCAVLHLRGGRADLDDDMGRDPAALPPPRFCVGGGGRPRPARKKEGGIWTF